jgi:hypothetical protein
MNFFLYSFIGCTANIVDIRYATFVLSVYEYYFLHRAIKFGPFCCPFLRSHFCWKTVALALEYRMLTAAIFRCRLVRASIQGYRINILFFTNSRLTLR